MSGFQVAFLVLLCRLKHGSDSVYVTASAGLAACAIGGTTLHSFAGIGLGNGDKETLLDNVMKKSNAKNRWLNAKAILIDEISMIDANIFVSMVSHCLLHQDSDNNAQNSKKICSHSFGQNIKKELESIYDAL